MPFLVNLLSINLYNYVKTATPEQGNIIKSLQNWCWTNNWKYVIYSELDQKLKEI